MIDRDVAERLLRDHLGAVADTSQPAGQLRAVVAATRRTRQRPAWMVRIRSGSDTGLTPRRVAIPSYAWTLGLLVLLALLVFVVAVASRPTVPHIALPRPGLLAVTREGALYLVDPETKDEVRLPAAEGMHFSGLVGVPGGRIAVTTEDGGVMLVDPASGEALPVSAHAALDTATWAPDGSTVAIVEDDAIRLVDIATGARRDLLPGPLGGDVWSMAWSPDGRSIAAMLAGQLVIIAVQDARVTTLDGAAPFGAEDAERRMHSFSSDYVTPDWSPDSAWLTFTRWGCTTRMCFDPGAIAVIGVDGRDERLLTAFGDTTARPRWGPDGEWIAFSSGPRHEVWSADMTSGEWADELWLIRPDGSEARALIPDAVPDFAWVPDGTAITFTRMAQVGELVRGVWQVDIATETIRDLHLPADAFAWQRVPAGGPPARVMTPRVVPPRQQRPVQGWRAV